MDCGRLDEQKKVNVVVMKQGWIAITKKKRVYGVWLQRKDDISYEGYKEKKNQHKRVVFNNQIRDEVGN